VVIHDRETVVIGGIIGQDTTSGEYKVPLFGDIPILGWLFKTHTNYEERTNLFIFITPHIVENPAEVASLYYQKRDVMNNLEHGDAKKFEQRLTGEVKPEHAVALSDLGFAMLQKKDYERAKQYFDEALKVDPQNPYALVNMGVVLEHEGKVAEAADMYRKVAEAKEAAGPEKGKEGEEVDPFARIRETARENLKNLNLPAAPEQPSPQ
jgi:general secretion pathway protein D